MTAAEDWIEPCRAAASWRGDAEGFFVEYFRAVAVGSGRAFATGYYEPEIAAARGQRRGYRWPVYAMPDAVPPPCTDECGDTPVLTRAAIENGALDGQGLAIAWARDLVDLYFLQVQGSGILRLPDGDTMRIGYAGNNGYPYTSIGRLMRDRGLLEDGQTTAEGIAVWLRDNPERGREIMQENRRYIFFTEVNGPGPLGSLGRPVTPRGTVAADPDFVPLGAPVFLDLEHDVADGLWIAQDTGSAIRGPNRFDTFWGAGEDAYAIASGMASRGQAYILIPSAAAARLRAD
ncbi:MAG: MltA domain-containing protein [Pseudomonadota bacterium]